jgi:hypothetical protein
MINGFLNVFFFFFAKYSKQTHFLIKTSFWTGANKAMNWFMMFKIHELVRRAYELVQNQSGDSREHFVPVHKNLPRRVFKFGKFRASLYWENIMSFFNREHNNQISSSSSNPLINIHHDWVIGAWTKGCLLGWNSIEDSQGKTRFLLQLQLKSFGVQAFVYRFGHKDWDRGNDLVLATRSQSLQHFEV